MCARQRRTKKNGVTWMCMKYANVEVLHTAIMDLAFALLSFPLLPPLDMRYMLYAMMAASLCFCFSTRAYTSASLPHRYPWNGINKFWAGPLVAVVFILSQHIEYYNSI
jgi:hypothetical protein